MSITTDVTSNPNQGVVADGYELAIAVIEADVRSMVEHKYADEGNASGLIKRLFLIRRIKGETADLFSGSSAESVEEPSELVMEERATYTHCKRLDA